MRVMSAPANLADAGLADLKQWLGITTAADDALLVRLLEGAVSLCERFTGCVPLQCTVHETVPASTQWRALATRPILTLLEVAALAEPGARRILSSGDYAVSFDGTGGARLRLSTLPAETRIEAVLIAGTAPDWAALDPALRHGILRYAAHQYRERDDETAANGQLPAAIAALWRPWRRLRL